MTAATSSETNKNSQIKSFLRKRYITGIGSNKKGLIVNCVMQLLGLPVAAVIALLLCYLESNYDKLSNDTITSIENGTMAFAVIAVAAVGISIITAIPTAMTHFSYLHKKSNADMHYALPLNNKQRFLADYLSGLTIYLAPVIAAVILAFAIFGVGSIFIDTSVIWENNIMSIAFKFGLVVFLGMLQLYTVAVFSLTFCGNGFEAGFSICAFNVLIPATIVCLWFAITETATFGVVPESLLRMNVFTDTSPAGAAAFLLNFENYFNVYGDVSNFNSTFVKWMLLNILCTAVYAVSAFFLYKSRKAEDVSKPYVHRSFFYALLTMAVFCVLSLFIVGDAPISAGIVICAVGWFVMEIITRRGFKKFWTAAIGFVAATAAVFGVIGICVASDGFGASKRIPSADSVKSVTLSVGDSYLLADYEYTDKNVIEEAIKLHQQCIDNHSDYDFKPVNKNDNIFSVANNLFRVTYVTKSGAVYTREYTTNQGMETELVKAMLLSDDAADFCTNNIGYKDYKNAQKPYVVGASFKGIDKHFNMNEEELKKLRGNLKADILEMTEEELEQGDVYCYLDNSAFVLKSFERTVAYLKDFGYDFSDATIDENFEMIVDPVFASFVGTDTYGYYDGNLDSYTEIESLCNTTSYFNGYMSAGFAYEINCENPYINELVNNMTNFIIGGTPIAVIRNYGSYYYLKDTDENRRLIENLMEYKVDEYQYGFEDEYEYTDEEIYYQ